MTREQGGGQMAGAERGKERAGETESEQMMGVG